MSPARIASRSEATSGRATVFPWASRYRKVMRRPMGEHAIYRDLTFPTAPTREAPGRPGRRETPMASGNRNDLHRRAFLRSGAAALGTAALLPSFQPSVFASLRPCVSPDRLEWWRHARFGLFIHWGLYSILAGEWGGRDDYAEWIRNSAHIPLEVYDRLVGRFNPVKFDADGWVG